jgi:hypothetical protein
LYERGTGTLSRNETLRRTFSPLRRAGAPDEPDTDAGADAKVDVDGRRVPAVEPEARLAARDAALPPSVDVLGRPAVPPAPRGRAGSPTPLSGLARLEPPAVAVRGRRTACEE